MGCSRLLTVTPKSHTKIEFLEDSDEKNQQLAAFMLFLSLALFLAPASMLGQSPFDGTC